MSKEGDWSLEADEEGFYAIFDLSHASPEPMFAEDMLRFKLFKHKDTGEFIIATGQGSSQQVVFLEKFRRTYVESKIEPQVGPQRARTELDLCVFRWARGGARLFISLSACTMS